jgi:hypothetical protein
VVEIAFVSNRRLMLEALGDRGGQCLTSTNSVLSKDIKLLSKEFFVSISLFLSNGGAQLI